MDDEDEQWRDTSEWMWGTGAGESTVTPTMAAAAYEILAALQDKKNECTEDLAKSGGEVRLI